jgi:hypothetical protein
MVYSRATTSAMAERWVLPVFLAVVDIAVKVSVLIDLYALDAPDVLGRKDLTEGGRELSIE